MLRLNEVIEKSKQLTNDNFSLFVDGILRYKNVIGVNLMNIC